jgi:predicted membrane protein
MIEFMATLFLGNLFVMATTILLIGFMFVLRTVLNVWFDTDFVDKIAKWFKADKEKKAEKKKIAEAEARKTWVIRD